MDEEFPRVVVGIGACHPLLPPIFKGKGILAEEGQPLRPHAMLESIH